MEAAAAGRAVWRPHEDAVIAPDGISRNYSTDHLERARSAVLIGMSKFWVELDGLVKISDGSVKVSLGLLGQSAIAVSLGDTPLNSTRHLPS
jgi:hypothetical protein